jgi:hypothetical protein
MMVRACAVCAVGAVRAVRRHSLLLQVPLRDAQVSSRRYWAIRKAGPNRLRSITHALVQFVHRVEDATCQQQAVGHLAAELAR